HRVVVRGANWTAEVRDVETSRGLLTLDGHQGEISCAAFSRDGAKIATGSQDRSVKIWTAASGQQLLTLTPRKGAVWALAFSSDGEKIAATTEEGTAGSITIWNANTGQELGTINADTAHFSIAFSPDGKRIASDGGRIWDAITGEQFVNLKGD